jgi:release factor glutamine methyltransferase
VSATDLGSTIAGARRTLAAALRAGGCETPDLDARLLVGEALALDHGALIAAADRPLSAAETARIAALAQRRLAGEPVARIRGSKEFWGLELAVTEAVLVPRPETETVVEAALAAVEAKASTGTVRIADLGTGSGALLIALLYELPNAIGIGTDRSVAALAVARSNAARHGLGARAHFVACDYGAALTGGFDLVVSNPPYIAHGDIAGLPREVRNYDPHLALDGGSDGLDAYRALAADGRRLLRPGGTMISELGQGQAKAITEIMRAGGLKVARPIRPDLAGIPRAIEVTH